MTGGDGTGKACKGTACIIKIGTARKGVIGVAKNKAA